MVYNKVAEAFGHTSYYSKAVIYGSLHIAAEVCLTSFLIYLVLVLSSFPPTSRLMRTDRTEKPLNSMQRSDNNSDRIEDILSGPKV